jgi:hypothetical protein
MQKARAVRSAFYSAIVFLTGSLSLWVTVLVQALVLIAVLHFIYRLVHPDRRGRTAYFVISLAAVSTLSWLVSTVMPDVFAAVAILLALALILYWERATRLERVLSGLGIAVSCVMHLSNPPLVFGVMLVAAVLRFSSFGKEWYRYGTVALGVALAMAATMMVSIVAFKQVSLTPNQPPFLLAHSIHDGPARMYLRDHCPSAGYEMCNYLDRLDVSVDDFVWHENGVYSVVPLEVAARIRAEEKLIFWQASMSHPWLALSTTLRDAISQLLDFSLADFYIPSYGYATTTPQHVPDKIVPAFSYDGQDRLDLDMYIRPTQPMWQQILTVPIYIMVIWSIGCVIVACSKGQLGRTEKQLFLLILAAVIINACIVAFSDISARYEARVMWLIPMFYLADPVTRKPSHVVLPRKHD